ncbi:WD40 repeat domain-containing protein [Phytohabitans sp. LJ34]|uniref:WD40 repeat domain-containing protein n=1 Tax=Phytohabitans sp. LJ34 TaxID=3452217 RepID=UPI003F8B5890
MSERLRQALSDAGSTVPPFDVYEAALARGRRLRRNRRLRITSALAAVAALVIATPVLLTETGDPPAPGAVAKPASLPDRVSMAHAWTATAKQAPAGPAALLLSGKTSPPPSLAFPETTMVAVGATDNTYRTWDYDGDAPAGLDAMLSPDGTRFVVWSALYDLVTGRSDDLPGTDSTTQYRPLGWAPDGDTLAVIRQTGHQEGGAFIADAATAGLLDLETGRFARLVDVSAKAVGTMPGHMVAFTPDGSRLAVQVGDQVTVFDRQATRLGGFTLRHDSQLAGKGAYTPDGNGLVVVSRAACCADDPGRRGFTSRWSLRVLDPMSGAEQRGLTFPQITNVGAVRLLGWWPSGDAIVVVNYPGSRMSSDWDPAKADPNNDAWGYPNQYFAVVRNAVLALSPDGRTRTLLTPKGDVGSLDIADESIASGAVRPGANPPIRPIRTGWQAAWLGLQATLAAVLVTIVLVVRRHRRSTPPTTEQNLR